MGTRIAAAAAAAIVVVLGLARPAFADAKRDIATKTKEAMENYDLMDYDAAKKLLNQALAIAKKARLDKDPVTARTYLHLGIAAFAAGDPDAAKLAFMSAAEIDAKIQIDAAYRSPELTKLLDQARAEAGGTRGGGDEPSDDGGVDCKALKGFQHALLETAPAGAALAVEAYLGSDVKAAKVAVQFRSEGATDFTEVKLAAQGCRYTGAIPAAAMRGSLVHYYVAAYDGNNKVVSSKGSSGSPNIIEISGVAAATRPDEEDPINGGKKVVATGDDRISGGVIAGGKPAKVYLAVSVGTGLGYVTGKTERNNEVQSCCVGNSLVVLTPEIGFQASRQLAIGIAGRFGVPVGANMEGHSTLAPGAVLRVRYAMSESGQGLRVMGQVGGGIMRNTIKVEGGEDGMDTDIVAQGPLLIGAGLGYTKQLSGSVAFVADLSVLAGIAVIDTLGESVLNTGVGGDFTLGVVFGF